MQVHNQRIVFTDGDAMTTLPDFASFRQTALDQGFDEVSERTWAPGQTLATHSHPFAARGLVVRGEMWLTIAGDPQHLQLGDRFELARDEPHAERYGAEGTTYWVARRHQPRADAED